MAVQTTIASLSQTAALNGPDGAVDPPSSLDDALRYHGAFIAQLRDGVGFTRATANALIAAASAAAARTALDASAPVFAAYQSTLQSLPASTFTKINLQSEEFDTAGAFDSTTNYRFQPLVAGYYQINGGLAVGGLAILASIYKNGAEFKRGTQGTASTEAVVSSLVQLNGSTDYVELYGFQGSGSSQNTTTGAALTYFNGALVRAS